MSLFLSLVVRQSVDLDTSRRLIAGPDSRAYVSAAVLYAYRRLIGISLSFRSTFLRPAPEGPPRCMKWLNFRRPDTSFILSLHSIVRNSANCCKVH